MNLLSDSLERFPIRWFFSQTIFPQGLILKVPASLYPAKHLLPVYRTAHSELPQSHCHEGKCYAWWGTTRQCRKRIWPIKTTTANKEISYIWVHVIYVLHAKVCLKGAKI